MSQEPLTLFEQLGSSESERAAQTFAVFSLIGFFTYCAIKLLMVSMLKKEEVDLSFDHLKRQVWRMGERLSDIAESTALQQEDLQQDLRILQERILKFGGEAESLRDGVRMLFATTLSKNTHSLRELEHYYKLHFEKEEQEEVD